LSLGGIPEKIKSIIQAVQKPVRKAIDFVVTGALKVAKPLVAGARGLVKGAKGLVAGIKGRFGKKDKGKDERAKDLDLPLPSLNLNKPVTMKGHSHSLLVHFRGPRIAVELASNPV